jgi:chromosome partitioning protein
MKESRHMFISLCNTKGGVGKSTLASHLAIWLYDRGCRVALLDTDIQQTSARWVRAAEPRITVRVATEMAEIQKARAELIAANDFVVVDTPGRESDAARTATLLADLAIIPLQPSPTSVHCRRH